MWRVFLDFQMNVFNIFFLFCPRSLQIMNDDVRPRQQSQSDEKTKMIFWLPSFVYYKNMYFGCY